MVRSFYNRLSHTGIHEVPLVEEFHNPSTNEAFSENYRYMEELLYCVGLSAVETQAEILNGQLLLNILLMKSDETNGRVHHLRLDFVTDKTDEINGKRMFIGHFPVKVGPNTFIPLRVRIVAGNQAKKALTFYADSSSEWLNYLDKLKQENRFPK